MKHFRISVAALLALVAISGKSEADTVTITTLKDNTLYFDLTGSLSNGAGPSMFCGMTGTGGIRRAIFAFDVARAVPDGSTINSVTLTLFMDRTLAGATQCGLHRVLADWGEGSSVANGGAGGGGAGGPAAPGDVTWIQRFYQVPGTNWITPGGDFDPLESASTSVAFFGPYTWGPTPEMKTNVQDWLDHRCQNFGWVLIGDESGPSTSKRFATKETLSATNQPQLTIDFTPPATPIIRGDLNHDGIVNADDVPGFVAVLLENDTTPADLIAADVNRDCTADADDVQAFVALLIP